MELKEKILDMILNVPNDEFVQWLKNLPLLDQPEALRVLKEILIEIEKNNVKFEPGLIDNLAKFADEYEEAILDQKLAEQLQIIENEKMEKAVNDMVENMLKMRSYVINSILNNAPNADEMRKVAKVMIDSEKEHGFYDPEVWKGVE